MTRVEEEEEEEEENEEEYGVANRVAAESAAESADVVLRFCDIAVKWTSDMTRKAVDDVVFEHIISSYNVCDLKQTILMLRYVADNMDIAVDHLTHVEAETCGQQEQLQILAEAADMKSNK
jgi:predicted urease superfamily metal-dependent hydrolase